MSGYVYFYVDESGHTGPNLFDPAQPVLYYGVLSSPRNVDTLALPDVLRLRNALGVERLHASELQAEQFEPLGPSLSSLQKRLDLRFDIYEVHKRDHAIIAFFDQIFDCHMNPAVAWHHYWMPMRYFLLLNWPPCLTRRSGGRLGKPESAWMEQRRRRLSRKFAGHSWTDFRG